MKRRWNFWLPMRSKRRVLSYIGRVSREEMRAIDDALQVSLDIHIPEEMEAP